MTRDTAEPDAPQAPTPVATAATSADAHPTAKPALFPIVCLGASAGGLKAVGNLLAEIPPDIGMAFVVIQHLDPHHDSHLPALLATSSKLPITEAVDGTVVCPNRVYIIMPNTSLGIHQGMLRVSPRETGPGRHLVIDAFLRALATDRPGSAIGVILSGTGADGTLGLAAIRAAGGLTFAQDDTAEYTGMPQSAIGQGQADFVLPPAAIAKELGKIVRFGFPALPPTPTTAATGDDVGESREPKPHPFAEEPVHFATILALLRTATGIDFTHYRPTTIARRTRRRMALIPLSTLAEYAHHLAEAPGEIDALAKDILINVTSFYRDHAVFASLRSVVFPALMKDRAAAAPIRLWVVGCSTGQEVYSLAIELMEFLKDVPARPQVQIFATDISDWALSKARSGCYPDSVSDEIPAELLGRYFTKEAAGYRVIKALRDVCVFAKHDVTADTPFSRLDLISCRNVLIYLGPVLQRYVLPTFHFALKPGGFLLLGTSEAPGRSANLYEVIDEKNRIYRSITGQGRIRPTPVQRQRAGTQDMPPNPPTFSPPVSEMQRAADQIVLGRFAPAGVLINEAMEIIQFRGHTNPYLEPAQGEASLNLLTMVPFGVADILREALDQARQQDLPVRRERVAHRRESAFREITIEVLPIRLPTSNTCYLVLFSDQVDAVPPAAAAGSPEVKAATPAPVGSDAPHMSAQREAVQLRNELAAATNYVRSLVELNQSLVEQLKDAQEEAQSGSEEFRTTNEELQTAKEEVDSTNEELVTLNEELRTTNEELTTTASDLQVAGALTAAIVETSRYPLLVLGANLHVESTNQAFLDTFLVTRQETIGRLVYDLGNGQWNIPELRRLLEDILPNHSAFDDFEVTRDFHAIGRKTMLLNARQLKGGNDKSRLIVLVIVDVTEQTHAAQTLKETAVDQLRSNAELDQFAAVAAHDLQEPLRMMSSFIGLLESRYGTLFDERARGYMAHVTNGAQRMKEMIEAILTYSRLGHEATVVADIDSAIPFASAMANLRIKIDEAHATIVEGTLPRVRANLEQLTQIFQNLLGNAVKFRSDHRPVVIRISAQEAEHEWVFAIADNGMGMDEADHERIFQLFQRVHTERQLRGTGIGLATCKRIVEHHQGRIWVESKRDAGSTFYFTLPR